MKLLYYRVNMCCLILHEVANHWLHLIPQAKMCFPSSLLKLEMSTFCSYSKTLSEIFSSICEWKFLYLSSHSKVLNWKFLEKILILTLSYLCLFHEYLYDWSFSCHQVFSCLLFHQHLRYNSNTVNFILWSVQCKDYQHVPKVVWLWPSIPFQNIFVVGYILDVPQRLMSWGLGPKSTYDCDEVET